MRPFLALVCVSSTALVAAGAGGSEPTASLAVTVSASAPRAVSGGRTPTGRRDYTVSFRVSVRSEQQCAKLVVAYSYTALFDGRRSLAGSGIDYYATNAPSTAASFDVRAAANAGDVVAFSGRASCENENDDVLATSGRVSARVVVAAHACEQGPLRVLAARGSVRREDMVSRKSVAVRGGHRVWTGYRIFVGTRSRIVFGATECHALRVIVGGPASFVPGDYSRGSYGTSTLLGYGVVAEFRGDQHAGGVETPNAVALPRGLRAGPSKLARFEIASLPKRFGAITQVRVRGGQVWVAGRSGGRRPRYGAPIVVRAGQRTVVRCARVCRPSAPTRG
jgi:hypothetical protein